MIVMKNMISMMKTTTKTMIIKINSINFKINKIILILVVKKKMVKMMNINKESIKIIKMKFNFKSNNKNKNIENNINKMIRLNKILT